MEQAAQNAAQAQTPKPLVVHRGGVGTGTTSLLMIFTVLCFATLAMLSLSTAVSSKRIQDRGIESSRALAAAKGATAEAVAALDNALLALREEYNTGANTTARAYHSAATGAAQSLGWQWNEEADTLSLTVEMGTGSQLRTTIRLGALNTVERYTVVSQITGLTDGWAPGEEGLLLLE